MEFGRRSKFYLSTSTVQQKSLPRKVSKCTGEIIAKFFSSLCQGIRYSLSMISCQKIPGQYYTDYIGTMWAYKCMVICLILYRIVWILPCPFQWGRRLIIMGKKMVGACGCVPVLIRQYNMPSFFIVYLSWEKTLKWKYFWIDWNVSFDK